MFRNKSTLLKANKKTVASMGLLSFEAAGLMLFKDNVYRKVYKISRKDKVMILDNEIKDCNYRFFYISAEGDMHLNYLSISIIEESYQEAGEQFEKIEEKYDITPLDFASICNQILGIRDKDYEFNLSDVMRRKMDLVKYLEKDDKSDESNFQEIEINVYPNACQSSIISLLKKIGLPYILMIEEEDISGDDIKAITRQLEEIYQKAPDIDGEYIFGKVRLMLFSLDEETLRIASDTIIDRLSKEGFVSAVKSVNDIDSYRFMTSIGLMGESFNTVVSSATLKAFI